MTYIVPSYVRRRAHKSRVKDPNSIDLDCRNEERSYYSSKESTDYIKDITNIENITKNCRRHEGS
jgi:hypothetical protein